MRQILFILTILISLMSCASMFNSKQTRLRIASNKPFGLVLNQDTIHSFSTEQKIFVFRNKAPLTLTVFTDRLQKTVHVKSKNSLAYWLNLYPNVHLWTGFLIDKNKRKRYTYPKYIYIDAGNTTPSYYTYNPQSRKGNFDLHISLPHINSFLLKPENETTKINTGFWGLNVGVDYYHAKNQFIHMGVAGVSDFFVPFLAAVDIFGEYELLSSRYLSLSNNHRIRRFSVGYGLSYTKNTWDLRYYDRLDEPPPSRAPIRKSHHSFGFIFPGYLQLGKRFHLGLVYRPTFFSPDQSEKFKYEHLISVDFGWKIRLKK
jgi:hypothetical protein